MTTPANKSSPPGLETESCQTPQSSAMSKHSSVTGTPAHIRAWLTSLPPASRASLSASQVLASLKSMRATAGQKPLQSFAKYDQSSRCWRTLQGSLLSHTCDEFMETWPIAGMTVSGAAYRLPKQEHRISAIAGGVLPTPTAQSYGTNQSPSSGAAVRESLDTMARRATWPTPTVSGNTNRQGVSQKSGDGLRTAVNRWPTPCSADSGRNGQRGDLHASLHGTGRQKRFPTPASRDYRHPNKKPYSERGGGKKGEQLPNAVGGALNPTWVEWLMGWPLGWTDLKPLEMDKFQRWCEQHGIG